MKTYLDALKEIMGTGEDRVGRNGDTRSLFGMQMKYNLKKGFPIITTKKINFSSIKAELLWFLSGSVNIKDLHKLGCHIWDANADNWGNDGDIGRGYGYQWRNWEGNRDQITDIIEQIKFNPNSRRLIVTAWNPNDIDKTALPPCHCFFQFYVSGEYLSLQLYQRSGDMFLGVPFNISSYSLLLSIIAQVTGKVPHHFIHTLGDAHIYHSHFKQVKVQVEREPMELPSLWINPLVKRIENFRMEDFELINYKSYGTIKAEMKV